MGYFKDTLKGLSWMGFLRVIVRGVSFIRTANLARILMPAQFGVYGIAGLALVFLETVTETGINIFLIQEDEGIEKYLNTAWAVSIVRGLLICLFIILSAPFVSSFFHSPESLDILYLTSIVPFLRGFINPAITKFQKEIMFDREFSFKLPIYLFDASVSVVLSLITKNPSSLIYGLIAGALLEVALSFIYVKPWPKFVFDRVKTRRVISRGKWVTASGIFDYLFQNIDDFSVGRILNQYSLGIYQIAYKISSLPITEISDVATRVTFPVYRKIATDKERLWKAFIKSSLAISALVLPLGLLIFLFPKAIILVVLGDKWIEAVAVLRVLALYGVLRGIFYPMMSVFLAVGKQEYITVSTLAGILGLGITVVPFVNKYGILGAGYSAVIGTVISIPVISYYLYKIFKNQR